MDKVPSLHKRVRLPNLRPVLFMVAVGVAYTALSAVYQDWKVRRDYDQRYSKLLQLPSDISRPKARLQRMPGVVGKALWIDFYQPNASEDERLRAWFTEHGGFSKFKALIPRLPKPIGYWRAERDKQFLIVSRDDENGWVHISYGQSMSPKEAERDLATYPWESEMQASQ
jgi:hypothetical protein